MKSDFPSEKAWVEFLVNSRHHHKRIFHSNYYFELYSIFGYCTPGGAALPLTML